MKNGIALIIFLVSAFMPLGAQSRKHEKGMMHEQGMMRERGMRPDPFFDRDMPPLNGRRFSEVQIRGRLKQRYMMSDADIDIILKARKQILDVMEKYQAPVSGN